MLEERVLPGHRSVRVLLVTILVSEWLSLAVVLDALPQVRTLALVRAALMVWLCWHVYRGRFWARVSLAGLLMFVGAAALLSAVGVLALDGSQAPTLMILGSMDVAGAFGLFALPKVRAYFDSFRRAY